MLELLKEKDRETATYLDLHIGITVFEPACLDSVILWQTYFKTEHLVSRVRFNSM